jgi:hypothetical protein
MSNESMRLHLVLSEFDESTTPDGKQKKFSITFNKLNGERVHVPRAVKCGLNMNLKKNAMRGIIPVDSRGNSIGHPTPVWIWSIVGYNGRRVFI